MEESRRFIADLRGKGFDGCGLELALKVKSAFPPLPTPVKFGGCASLCCITRAR